MEELNRLVIHARLDDVRQACDAVVEAAERAQLDERAVYHCQMAVDETLTNIIEHGYAFEGDQQQIQVACQADAEQFFIVITDDSPAFNPLEHQAPDPDAPLDTREPGGWGIYFIRRLMDDVRYARVTEGARQRNQLTLVKNRPTADLLAAENSTQDQDFPVETRDALTAVISPSGRLDSNTSPRLEQVLTRQLDQGVIWIYVDMSSVDYIASSGLKVLVAAWRRARENGGDVVLSQPQPRIIEILEMVGFDMLFQIFDSLNAALAARPSGE